MCWELCRNEQFVNKCDAAVAIFWTKFGSPTDEYGSGTEEEIERMLQSGKQVFMYFSDKSIQPSQMNSGGYEKIQAFREKYKDRGIYFTYSSDEEFNENPQLEINPNNLTNEDFADILEHILPRTFQNVYSQKRVLEILVEDTDYRKEGDEYILSFNNQKDEDAEVVLPIFAYRYVEATKKSGEKIDLKFLGVSNWKSYKYKWISSWLKSFINRYSPENFNYF